MDFKEEQPKLAVISFAVLVMAIGVMVSSLKLIGGIKWTELLNQLGF